MAAKHVYFIRHGESTANLHDIHGGKDVLLTAKGIRQAEAVADKLASYNIEQLLSSDYMRAMQTAEIIGNRIGLPAKVASPLFGERINPSSIVGRSRKESEVILTNLAVSVNFVRKGWKHSDEESYDELHARMELALNFLRNQKENHIAVVSHGIFLKLVLAHVILRSKLSAVTFRDFFLPLETQKNTGIFHIVLTGTSTDRLSWKMITWNDHSHLLYCPEHLV